MELRKGYVITNFGQIHYRYAGKGRPLLLLHPSPRSSRIFEKLMLHLAENYFVLAPDTLGFGYSDPLPTNVTMEILASSFLEFINNLSLEEVSIFGLHTGNKIGSALGLTNSKKIKKIILCGMSHSIILDNKKRNFHINELVEKYFSDKSNERKKYNNFISWAKTFRSISNSWWSEKILENSSISDEDFDRAQIEAIDFINSRKSFDLIYRANFDFDFDHAIRNIMIPTLIIELVCDKEKHIGPQGKKLVNAGHNIQLSTFENSMTGVMSVGGRDSDLLEVDCAKLNSEISNFINNT